LTLEELAAMMGKVVPTTPEPQQARSGQLPSESANADQQLLQPIPPASSDANLRTNPTEGDADNIGTSNSWPVQGSSLPTSDPENVAAHMAILLALMKGKIPINDAVNAPPGSDLRSSPQ